MNHRTLVPLVMLALAALSFAAPAHAATAPTASFSVASSPAVGTGVLFNGLASSDADGDTLTYNWTFGDGISGSGGIISHGYAAAGTYTATLTVSDGALTNAASATVTVAAAPVPAPTHGAAVAVDITPASVTLTADATQAFTAKVRDAGGLTWDVTNGSTWSENDPRGSLALDGSGVTYTPGKVGTWTISATYGSVTGTALVTVTPGAVAHVVVNPSTNPEPIALGTTTTFTAEAFDADWNAVPSADTSWTVTDAVGSTKIDGTFTPKKEGTGSIVATVAGITGTTVVTVVPKKVEITLDATTEPPTPTAGTPRTVTPKPADTGIVAGTETLGETAAPAAAEAAKACSSLHWWGWLGILVGYLVVLYFVLYATRRLTGPVFWVLPLALTAAALWGYFQYRCGNSYPWFPWLAVLGGLIVALFRPLPPEPPILSNAPAQPS